MYSKLRRVLAIAALLAVPAWLSAQETRVTGQVTADDSGQPLAGVQIVVKGTTVGTLTDGNGNYALRVPAGSGALIFSYLGYRTIEHGISGPVVNVTLSREAIGLEGITVTALGIQREKRSLGYSVQDVQAAEITDVPKMNVVDALHGNVAGVHITNTSAPGGASRIVIRGASSISGNNQPLFIVDGVPIDNRATSNGGGSNSTGGGYNYGNRAADIDPNNIESISVLKGPNAAALYGSRAANGAVVITTKKGYTGTGLGITASVSTMFDSPLRLPSYQNQYGQGSYGDFQWVDGNWGGVADGMDESWGPRLSCDTLVDQFSGKQQPWCPHPDNVRNFFETGVTVNTNVAVAHSSERSNVRLSVSNMQMNGMYPTNEIKRIGAALAGGVDVTDRLRAEGTLDYTKTEGIDRPGTGYSGRNMMQQFIWFGRQVDIASLKNYQCIAGDKRPGCELGNDYYNWNYSYHDNPYVIANENTNNDVTDHVIGHAMLSYDLTDWLTAMVRTGTDWYQESRDRNYAWGTYGGGSTQGSFAYDNIFNRETNTDFLVTATRSLTPDITLTVNAGGNRRDQHYTLSNYSSGALVVPGIYTLDNSAEVPGTSDNIQDKRVNSLYGSASVNYRNYLNIDVTGRNDWSSTLPEENNSYFYPSVSGAFVFTDAFGLQSNLLSSGKVRASWTRVGNDAGPYQLISTMGSNDPYDGIPMFSVPNELANAGLKPEETTAWEVGTDLGFLNERAGFVITYYDNSTVNQIMGVQVSATSGYTRNVMNAGEVRNWGWELMARLTPINQIGGLRWDMSVNWAKNNSQVVSLTEGVETLVLGSYWGLNIEARKDKPYGALVGNPWLRDDQGRIVVDADNGVPLQDPDMAVLGNYNPDWTGGLLNQFTYKNFDFSFLFDMQHGGDVYSVSNMFGEYAGVLEGSLRGREKAWDSPGVLVPNSVYQTGTDANGDPIYTSNSGDNAVYAVAQDYFEGLYPGHEPYVHDASYIKLREMRIGYRLPAAWVGKLGFGSADIALIGRNLALWTDMPNIDPETAFSAGNVQGIEFGQFPTARSIGFTVTVRP